ncbi:M23 family metallopeptidase [Clostridium sp.]|uniref:M23 family metallopeptidase n=1 Tax=Clostridium sp. TaxID=1506 RepID=UPI002615D536|nr:M23 family metallopeptidase [Clostridium sp.]
MDQNNKNKVKTFFRKEGFYLVLFLCLCLIATVTVVTTRNKNLLKNNKDNGSEFTLKVDDKATSETQKQNAERVENEEEGLLAEESEKVDVDNQEDVNVSSDTTTKVVFKNPINGELLREYTYPKPQLMTDGTSRNVRGIDVKAEIGTEVMSAAVGEVKEVSNKTEEGTYVVIAHANGLYTKYTNLAKDTRVNVGDRVTEETVIGTVGETSKIFVTSEFGEHLNIQVYDVNGKDLNPTSYFTFNQ